MNPAFVDVETNSDGSPLTGCNERDDVCGDYLPVFEESITPIPRSQWQQYLGDESLEMLQKKVKNQGREGSCASNATVGGCESPWNLCCGMNAWIEFSPMSVYRWVARGPGSGSTIGSNLRQIRDVGCLPVDNSKNRQILSDMGLPSNHVHPSTGWNAPFASGWKDTAQHFRSGEAYDIRSFDGMITAVIRKFVVIYGRAGHAIFGVRPVYRNGVWYIKYQNSWGAWGERGDNGLQGYGHDSESFVSRAISSYGAFAIRVPLITDVVFKWAKELGK